jgi:hypothetical protein
MNKLESPVLTNVWALGGKVPPARFASRDGVAIVHLSTNCKRRAARASVGAAYFTRM